MPFFEDGSPIPYTVKRCAQPAIDGDNETDWEWECDPKGKAPPFSFTVAAYETDDIPFSGNCWNDQVYRRPDGQYTDLRLPDYEFCIETDGQAELIGKRQVELKLEDLAELTAPGQSLVGEVDLGGGCDFTEVSACDDSAPHYRLRYVVKRVPDATGGVLVDPNPNP